MPRQQPFDALIKVRCFQELVARIARIAKRHKREYPDMLRIGFEEYADAQEKALGLKPITDQEVVHYYSLTVIPPKRPTRKKDNGAPDPAPVVTNRFPTKLHKTIKT